MFDTCVQAHYLFRGQPLLCFWGVCVAGCKRRCTWIVEILSYEGLSDVLEDPFHAIPVRFSSRIVMPQLKVGQLREWNLYDVGVVYCFICLLCLSLFLRMSFKRSRRKCREAICWRYLYRLPLFAQHVVSTTLSFSSREVLCKSCKQHC